MSALAAVPDPTPGILHEYVQVMGDLADQIATAETLKDKDTLKAADLAFRLFEDKAAWVERGLELVPLPKNGKSNWGQKPDTMARFHKVSNALLKQAGREHLIETQAVTVQAITSGRAWSHVPKSSRLNFTSERQIRGLRVLVTSGDVARIPEAVEIARQAAAERGSRTVSGAEVTKAARLVKAAADRARRDGASAGKSADAYKIDRLRAARLNAEDALDRFLELAKKKGGPEAVQQVREFQQHYRQALEDLKK